MSFYAKHVLPRLINLAMRNKDCTRLRELWIPRARGEVLEIGIGSGLNLLFYPATVEHVYGVEPSIELQQMARKQAPRTHAKVDFLTQSAEAPLPLSDASIDALFNPHPAQFIILSPLCLRPSQPPPHPPPIFFVSPSKNLAQFLLLNRDDHPVEISENERQQKHRPELALKARLTEIRDGEAKIHRIGFRVKRYGPQVTMVLEAWPGILVVLALRNSSHPQAASAAPARKMISPIALSRAVAEKKWLLKQTASRPAPARYATTNTQGTGIRINARENPPARSVSC
jgi:hypothetical protein